MDVTAGWIAFFVVIGMVVLAVAAAVLGHVLVRRGIREPLVVRMIDRGSERIVSAIQRPITVAVLDEVADVLKTGNYTRNIAAALRENHDEIKQMIAEKIEQDPTTKRIGLLPFHDRLIDEVSETALRVLLALLVDPRTDELVSDTLRDNLTQIRAAVRDRQTEL
jgi:hypothetical protein